MTELGGDATLAGDEQSTGQPERVPTPEPDRGDMIARFVVLERKGGGSMGVVFAAYDPELDRKVALKLLHPRRSLGPRAADERRRLLREAQAMARVNHPNVIAIHDVGEHEGGVFLAMEYIDGPTLAQWLGGVARTIPEILEVFAAAGRGLAAAHAKNLVHRDFKPDNVMLDDDGRVRVLDFGLVHTANDEAQHPEEGIVGTPAYMAPEQLVGHGVDARSDQFSFCVALYEAVYRVRPFVGRDLVSLGASISAGIVAAPPATSTVPSWLRRVILRGLSVEQDARWPDMNALVAALAGDRTHARRRMLVALGVGALAIGAGGVLVLGESERERCERVAAESSVWDATRRDALARVVLGDETEFRRDTWTRVASVLDARAESLQAATTAACLAAPTDALAGARQLCVARHRRALAATITALSVSDLDGLVAAITTVDNIPDALACDDAATLGDELAPPAPEIADRVQRARDDLARAHAEGSLGHHAQALEIAEAARTLGRELGYAPLVAEAGRTVGAMQAGMTRFTEAEVSLREAFATAIEVGDDRLAIRIAARLATLVGENAARPAEGLVWGEIGRALLRRGHWIVEEGLVGGAMAAVLDRSGDPRAALAELQRVRTLLVDNGLEPDGDLMRALSSAHRRNGEGAAAREWIELALAGDTARLGAEHPLVADDLSLLGAAYHEQGEYALAIEHYERSIAIFERALGREHEKLSPVLSNLATSIGSRGDYAAALPIYERALAISAKALGPEHPDTLDTAANIAALQYLAGDTEGAIRRQLELLPILERAFGPEHINVGGLLANLGSAETHLGLYGDAIVHLERAVAITERAVGDNHIDFAAAIQTLADAYAGSGDAAKALALFERSLAIYERVREPDHADLSWPLLGVGAAALELGDETRAIAAFQRALALREAAQLSAEERGIARFLLARALWTRADARADALALARTAREERSPDAKAVAEIDAWLREHTL